MRLLKAAMADARFVWRLRNRQDVREQSQSSEWIALDEHLQWMRNRVLYPYFWIVSAMGGRSSRIGYIRLDGGYLSYALIPQYRGRGWGRRIVRRALAICQLRCVSALVYHGNIASLVSLLRNGFRLHGMEGDWAHLLWIRPRKRR